MSAVLIVALMGTSACAGALQIRPERQPEFPTMPARQVTRGSLVMAQIREPLSTERSREGDRFSAELLDPLVDEWGEEAVPRGAVLEGVIERVSPSGPLHPTATLQLGVTGVRMPGTRPVKMPLEVASIASDGESRWPGGVMGAIAGAALGAGVGLLADHTHGSVVGGAALAGLGLGALVGVWGMRRDVYVPSGALLTLRVVEAIPSEAAAVLRRSTNPVDGRKTVSGQAPFQEDGAVQEPGGEGRALR